jgi:hypothetical protein
MSALPMPAISYEKQIDPENGRMCGAAALAMVYGSFGQAIGQAEIWPRISKYNRVRSLAAATHLMTRDALNRGLEAVAIQAANPLVALRSCQDNGIRAILNHRLREDIATGHFTVLVDINGEHVVLHDPYFGPSRRVGYAELLELWRPRYLNAEISGNMLIGIAAPAPDPPPCRLCGTVIPPSVTCPGCGQPVPLRPAAVLGCVSGGCPGRLWNYLCCPSCDHTWTFDLGSSPPPAAAGPQKDALDLDRLFTELDKFCAFVLGLPAAAGHPDVLQQVNLLKAGKDQLKLARSEVLHRRQMKQAQMAQLVEKSKQEEQAFVATKDAIAKPAPPLDGNALGQDLVKDLGLLENESALKTAGLPSNGSVTPSGGTRVFDAATGVSRSQRQPPDDDILELLRKKGLY